MTKNHLFRKWIFVDVFVYFVLQLTVTDDTVLEEHNEDPSLIQMNLLGDGGKFTFNITFRAHI